MLKIFKKNEEFEKIDHMILGASYGESFSFRKGAEKGPQKIIHAFDNNLESFDRFTKNEPDSMCEYGYYEIDDLSGLDSYVAINKIKDFILKSSKFFTILLGGAHNVSIGFFLYLKEKYNPSEITILQIDAHPDLRDNTDDYKQNGGSYDHACVMRRAFDMGFNTIQVGIRTYSRMEFDFMQKNNLKIFEWGKNGTPKIKDIIDSIKTDKVYLTIDVDGIDPAHTPATGTPVPGGLEWFYTQELIRELISKKDLIGADIVEVSPVENDVLTEYAAAQLCYNISSYKFLKDKGILKYYI